MADYGCYTWTKTDVLFQYRSAELNDNLDLMRLGVSVKLVSALGDWHAEWEQHAWGDVPFSAAGADAWERRGWALARELQNQLPDFDIHVFDYETDQVTDIPKCHTGTSTLNSGINRSAGPLSVRIAQHLQMELPNYRIFLDGVNGPRPIEEWTD